MSLSWVEHAKTVGATITLPDMSDITVDMVALETRAAVIQQDHGSLMPNTGIYDP
ncbi:MAG TPA: hypothetical protein VK817_18075 [Trebonia sp.]|nr:hypothetical protein [Trebonia sp.]